MNRINKRQNGSPDNRLGYANRFASSRFGVGLARFAGRLRHAGVLPRFPLASISVIRGQKIFSVYFVVKEALA